MVKFKYDDGLKIGSRIKIQVVKDATSLNLPELVVDAYDGSFEAFTVKWEHKTEVLKKDKLREFLGKETVGKTFSLLENLYATDGQRLVFLSLKELSEFFSEIELQASLHPIKDKFLSNRLRDVLQQVNSPVARYILDMPEHVRDSARNININKEGTKLTYLPKGRECILTGDGKWAAKSRQESKIGRLFNSFLPSGRFSKQDVEKFVNEVMAVTAPSQFKIVQGEDIRKYYHEDCYDHDAQLGSLSGSCMRHDRCQKYFDIYVNNECCSLVIMESPTNKGTILGRALLWKTDEFTFMDRVYASDSNQLKFKNYADSQGWMRKAEQSHSTQRSFVMGGKVFDKVIKVPINATGISMFPYFDTLCYLYPSEDGDVLSNYDYKTWGDEVIYASVCHEGGHAEWNGGRLCASCGKRHKKSSMIDIEGQLCCADCVVVDPLGNKFAKHTGLSYEGKLYSPKSVVKLYSGATALIADTQKCSYSKHYGLEDEFVDLQDGDTTHKVLKKFEAEAKFVMLGEESDLSVDEIIDLIFK